MVYVCSFPFAKHIFFIFCWSRFSLDAGAVTLLLAPDRFGERQCRRLFQYRERVICSLALVHALNLVWAALFAAKVRVTAPACVVLRVKKRAIILIFGNLVSWTLLARPSVHCAVGRALTVSGAGATSSAVSPCSSLRRTVLHTTMLAGLLLWMREEAICDVTSEALVPKTVAAAIMASSFSWVDPKSVSCSLSPYTCTSLCSTLPTLWVCCLFGCPRYRLFFTKGRTSDSQSHTLLP